MKLTIDKNCLGSLLHMASFVEARDAYTGGHLWRVSRFSKLLATKIGLSKNEVAVATLGGFLHDLGKIGIPDSILSKPGRLTPEEFDIIKTHTTVGFDLIQAHPLSVLVQEIIHHHHEWCDGSGYPLKLKKEEISIYARIVGLVDAFDAMTSQRVYRPSMSIDKALSIIDIERDTHFDGELVDALIDLNSTAHLEHIVGHSNEGIPLLDCYICGPIIVRERDAVDGDYVFCRGCSGKFKLHLSGSIYKAIFVNEHGSAEDVRAQTNTETIDKILQDTPIELDDAFSISHDYG